MIKRFRHKGLERLYEDNDKRGLNLEHVEKIERILARLQHASQPKHMDLPGYRLHLLRGKLQGFWSVVVKANWRIIFRFDNGDVTDVNYIDYH